MVRVCRPLRTLALPLCPIVRTDNACGTTRLAGVRHVWGPGGRPRVCRLFGKAQPRILTARLLISLPVHVSCFDLYIVYTNMLGVTLTVLRHVFPVTYQGYSRNEGRSIRMYHTSLPSVCIEILNCRFGTLIQLGVPITILYGNIPACE